MKGWREGKKGRENEEKKRVKEKKKQALYRKGRTYGSKRWALESNRTRFKPQLRLKLQVGLFT